MATREKEDTDKHEHEICAHLHCHLQCDQCWKDH
ncbi:MULTISPECIES: hypothetical protein [unclassified Dyella]